MAQNMVLKNNFQPREGVNQSSLLHCDVHRARFCSKNGPKWRKTARKTAQVSVSEHTFPVSIYFLDFYLIGALCFWRGVKIAKLTIFTSED